jgi:hypothetical protein
MTNLLINPCRWNSTWLKDLAPVPKAARASLHVFLASPKTAFARRKQSTPTGIPQ